MLDKESSLGKFAKTARRAGLMSGVAALAYLKTTAGLVSAEESWRFNQLSTSTPVPTYTPRPTVTPNAVFTRIADLEIRHNELERRVKNYEATATVQAGLAMATLEPAVTERRFRDLESFDRNVIAGLIGVSAAAGFIFLYKKFGHHSHGGGHGGGH